MCGIIGILGLLNSNQQLWSSLHQLQNRGYDSAGICNIHDNKFELIKYSSDEIFALDKLKNNLDRLENSDIGIAHTRWATHGEKNDINSHPHLSMDNKIAIVHNGIIENYKELKTFLEGNNIKFKSETDSEVICNLISYYYKNNDIRESINLALFDLQGTWSIVIMCIDNPNKIYCTRKGSPLLIAKKDNYAMVTSEISGFCNKVDNYIVLDNNDVCEIEKDSNNLIKIYTLKKNYVDKKIKINNNELTPYPYKYWSLKEINEQIDSCLRAISLGGRLLSMQRVKLGGLQEFENELKQINHLVLLGCGTSYYAGMVGSYYFKENCSFDTVQIFDGGEFDTKSIPKNGKTAFILMSQSGETKDLFRCLEIAKDNNIFTIGVINVVDSTIAREVNCGCYLNAGREVAVASTKSFTSQIIVLTMISVWFCQNKNENFEYRENIIKDLRKLYLDIEKIVNSDVKIFQQLADKLCNKKSIFILGRNKAYPIALEGALKLKEMTYIHAEGYSTNSLKHGPFSLLEEDFPVILIDTDPIYRCKVENTYEELKSRKAYIITISNYKNKLYENNIEIPNNKSYSELLSVIIIQLISYHLALKKNINMDFPRNLAKSVVTD